MNFEQYAVVVVPFPFSDKKKEKKRPAVVISNPAYFDKKINHSVLAMVTSAKNSKWPLDTIVSDLNQSGLPAPSVIRMKFFTIDHKLILGKLGSLSPKDQKKI